jgi:glycosyltransferase involved in cell wall biosynthesis
MNIGIIGSRGIPNSYGGFEQFAQYLSKFLVERGHSVVVYNGHDHPYKANNWEGVNIIHKYDPEKRVGTIGQFFYDLLCILDSRKQRFDVILQLGYTSSSIWSMLFPKTSKIVTNMDGFEWKRTKYSKKVRRFLLFAERWGVKYSDHLVADSIGIQEYLLKKYGVVSTYIPYGAEVVEQFESDLIAKYDVKPFEYNLILARLEPENNFELILDGFNSMPTENNIVLVVGNFNTKYGAYLKNRYLNNSNIRFLGGIYNTPTLNSLRHFAKVYFHGHMVGGTNPSLLEAMGAGALICAYDNIFNRSILGDHALFFNSKNDIIHYLKTDVESLRNGFVKANYVKVESFFTWPKIVEAYESLFNIVANDVSLRDI